LLLLDLVAVLINLVTKVKLVGWKLLIISLMWIQSGFTHYILGITLILTLVAANPYRPPTRSSKLLLNTQWPDPTGHYKYASTITNEL